MRAFGFKAGIGTASRAVGEYTVGVLVQANYGKREQLLVAGVPVGREITDLMPTEGDRGDGSVIVVVATDAPLLPHQLRRLAKRAALGLARTGSVAENTSGDLVLAFSTAHRGLGERRNVVNVAMLPNDQMTPLFAATVQATEEAVVNALVAAETMTGINGRTVFALPHDRLRQVLRKYNRLG
jgi:L-aminopeptidase/D-esterase-like protein